MFRTQFDPHERVIENPGSPIRTIYSSRVAEDGNIELIESGTENIYDLIQSHKDSVDIHMILTRFVNGDESALSKTQGQYGDFTELPKSYAELLNAVIAGENYFNSLPLETRAKFDHSFEKFMVSMDNMPKFFDLLGVELNDQKADLKDAPVVDQESSVKEVAD